MAAATVSEKKCTFSGSDLEVREFRLSAMTSDQAEDVAHGGPSGVLPSWVHYEIYTPATTGDLVVVEHHPASDSTSNNTVRLKARVESGGDITGCVVRVFVAFIARASGGLNP